MGTISNFIADLINAWKLRSFMAAMRRHALAERMKEIWRDPKTLFINRNFGKRE